MIIGDFGHCPRRRISQSQGTPRQVHPPQPEILVRAHPQLFLTMQTQCPIRNTDPGADFCYVERLILSLREHLFEPLHDWLPRPD